MNINKVKEYVQTQMLYDHKKDFHSTNTQAMIKNSHDLIINTVKNYAKENKIHILDIGCGWGDFSDKLDYYIKDYIGIEPSLIELNRFIQNGRLKNRYLVRGVGENLDYLKDNSRNVILLNSVLDHCFDWEKTINNCKRILSPGGIIIIAMENSNKITLKIKKLFGKKVIHEGHLSHLSGEDIKRVMSPNYRIVENKSTGYLFGLHKVTRYISIPVRPLITLNRIFNTLFSVILPQSGHLLYYVFTSSPNSIYQNQLINPFRCPSCSANIEFGTVMCESCRYNFMYEDGKYLITQIISE